MLILLLELGFLKQIFNVIVFTTLLQDKWKVLVIYLHVYGGFSCTFR